MKKYFALAILAVFGGLFLQSCERVYNTPTTTTTTTQQTDYPKVYDLNVNFTKSTTSNNLYGVFKSFTNPLYNSDVVLIYRQDGSSNGAPIWKLLPKTYYMTQGALDYTFDFTKNDISIYANGNFDMSIQDNNFKNTYLNNQVFRVVIVPAVFGKSSVNKENYKDVIQYYQIDETKIGKL